MPEAQGARDERHARPEWVACVVPEVGPDHDLYRKTWCGLPVIGWNFEGADHAALNGRAKGRLVACPACVRAITAGLVNGHEDVPGPSI